MKPPTEPQGGTARVRMGGARIAALLTGFAFATFGLVGTRATDAEGESVLRIVQHERRILILTPETAVVLDSVIPLPDRDTTGVGTLEYDDATGAVRATLDGSYEFIASPHENLTRVATDHIVTRARSARVRMNLDPTHVAIFDPQVVMNRFFYGGAAVTPLETTCQKSTGRVCKDDDCLAISRMGGTYRCGGLITLNPQGGGSGTTHCFSDEYACFNCQAGYLLATCKDLYHCDKYSESCGNK